MHILLFGKNGQVGWELQRALAPLGKVTAIDFDSSDFCGDFSQPAAVAETVLALKPDVIVNAAAHTAVDKAESEPELACLLNAESVKAIAMAAEQIDAWLVHYSTDYVFDGSGESSWQESDKPAPLSVYGHTKLEGEQAVQRCCSRHLIFRTSWVYAARGANFAKTMLRLGKDRKTLSIINDQFGAPTGAELLADCTAHAIRTALQRPDVAGLYHLVAAGTTNWFDYAAMVFQLAHECGVELAVKTLNPISTSAYPTPATRPLNSRLDTSKFETVFGLRLQDWQQGVRRMLTEILK